MLLVAAHLLLCAATHQDFTDESVDGLLQRAIQAPPLRSADVDNTMLGKEGSRAPQRQMSHISDEPSAWIRHSRDAAHKQMSHLSNAQENLTQGFVTAESKNERSAVVSAVQKTKSRQEAALDSAKAKKEVTAEVAAENSTKVAEAKAAHAQAALRTAQVAATREAKEAKSVDEK